ncbi:DUF2604 domain-containing protein [Brevundimonas sp.]|uniref:DUF2604 domain-containing protein n=1 Tax=Brevundimonas sp. TaxID=1871086 RepID=UPI00272F2DDC|nr:DUF2604 domain-containing protein [Brevundimonas sp.]MDP1912387.1 hypothetical protein [Brevundimonas sp.]
MSPQKPDDPSKGPKDKPPNKITITVIYNGAPMPLEVSVNQALQAVLQDALQLFGIGAGPLLFNEAGQELALNQSVKDAGLVEGSRVLLRPRAVAGGVPCG